MTEREKLIELIERADNECRNRVGCDTCKAYGRGKDCLHYLIADHLLSNGVIVTPCVAMVEQFIKDGKFDKKHTAHNGRFAVVYRDKTKSNYTLIDITEQFYDTEKANERIKALKERSEGK